MGISDLRVGQGGLVIIKIISKGPVREFNKFGRVGRVCECIAEDDSGTEKLVLWDDDIERFKEGETIEIPVHVKIYKGEKQLNLCNTDYV